MVSLTLPPLKQKDNASNSRSLRSALRVRLFPYFQFPRSPRDRLARRHRHFEHAIMELRRGVSRVRTFGQRHAPIEKPVAALRAIVIFALFFVFAAAFALDR